MRRRDERGASALEFALVFPVVLLVVFGIIQYGYQYWALSTASAAAREAARQAVVGTDWTCVVEEARDKVSVASVGEATEVTLAYADEGSGPTPSPANVAPQVGDVLAVTVSFESLDLGLPLLPLPDDGQVSETATARVASVPVAPLPC